MENASMVKPNTPLDEQSLSIIGATVPRSRFSPQQLCLIALSVIALAFSLFAAPAFCDPLGDAIGAVVDPIVSNGVDNVIDNLKSVDTGMLTHSFKHIFSEKDTVAYKAIKGDAQTIASVCGYTVLAIVFLIQLVQIANKLDGNAAVPGLKEVIFLLIFFVVMKVIIDNAVPICESIYNFVNYMIEQIGSTSGNSLSNAISSSDHQKWKDSFTNGDMFANFITVAFMELESFAVQVVTYFAILARGLQLYLYTLVSPIALTFLGSDQTRAWGVGFCKSYIAMCLAGLIIAATVLLIGPICSSVLGATDNPDAQKWSLIAVFIVYIVALAKSGSWARDILGG
jgi:hypothetical protein